MSNQKAILVVDDEKAIRDAVCEALEAEGYYAVGAESGPHALIQAELQHFDAIITDIRMPEMSGFQLVFRLRKDYPDLIIIMLTAVPESQLARVATTNGVYAYLNKPCKIKDIVGTLDRAFYEKQQKAILVVDDEDAIRDAVCEALEDAGYYAVGAASGSEAIVRAKARHFDAVITDIRMPKMSGFQLVFKLRKSYPDMVIIMLTAVPESQSQLVRVAKTRGVAAYLHKPCKIATLLETLEKSLAGTEQEEEELTALSSTVD